MSWPSRRPEGSSPLHNFSLPPSLKWGAQKVLRCAKSPSLRRSASTDDSESLRGKLMRDLRMADSITPALDGEEEEDDESNASRPWNLRTRRAACRAPGESGGAGGDRIRESSGSPMRSEKGSRRIRDSEKRGREKFSIELSKEEVELDYLVMVGIRPPRRPKKRPRTVQRQLEFVFPGSWLTEITMERYRVPDCPELVKNLQA